MENKWINISAPIFAMVQKKKKMSITTAICPREMKPFESKGGKIQLERLSLTELQAENRI